MSNGDLNWIANFIWGIADDALRDLYVRGKHRDVILPMMVQTRSRTGIISQRRRPRFFCFRTVWKSETLGNCRAA
jgi:hypothetical protein